MYCYSGQSAVLVLNPYRNVFSLLLLAQYVFPNDTLMASRLEQDDWSKTNMELKKQQRPVHSHLSSSAIIFSIFYKKSDVTKGGMSKM